MERPSNREIDKRLNEAKEALKEKHGVFANPNKAVGELMNLEINDSSEVWGLIGHLLTEIEITNYDGGYPPKKNSEPLATNCELWAFSWESKLLNKEMYLKFALKNGVFYYISLHETKYPKGLKS